MHQFALEPEDLARLFVERINAGDLEGVVALYEPDAILACGEGRVAVEHQQIRQFYKTLLSGRPQFAPGVQASALRNGNIALTLSMLANGTITTETARQQANGSWLWAIDQPAIVSGT